MPSLLRHAILPVPLNNDRRVHGTQIVLRWTPARHARRQQVVLTPCVGPTLELSGTERQIALKGLAPHTTYTWRVDTFTPADTVQGKVWNFTTE